MNADASLSIQQSVHESRTRAPDAEYEGQVEWADAAVTVQVGGVARIGTPGAEQNR